MLRLSRRTKGIGLVTMPLVLLACLNQVRPRVANIGTFEEKEYEKSQSSALKELQKLDQEHRFTRKLVILWMVRFKDANGFYEVFYERGAQKMSYSVKFRGSDPYFNDAFKSNCARITSEDIAGAARKNDLGSLVFGDGCVDNFPRHS